jgi:hypothetical protein
VTIRSGPDFQEWGNGRSEPVTSATVLIGWLRQTPRGSQAPVGAHMRLPYARTRVFSGVAAAVAIIVVGGCTSMTDGNPSVNRADAPIYRASVTASVQESAASSSAKESEHQASQTTQAIHTACETLSTTSADAVDGINAFVDAINGESDADPLVAAPAAVDALNNSADTVATDTTDGLPQEVRDALGAWSDAARAAAVAVADRAAPDQFNVAIRQLNDSRSTALNLCDGYY